MSFADLGKNMGLFANLHVGRSGLVAGQEALNVVAHNVTNADTEGYVRQQVQNAGRRYNALDVNITGVAQKQIGLGVDITEVRQVRDRFLDESYREEYGRQGFYDVSYGAIEEIEGILGELDGATFSDSVDSLWSAIEELVKDPSNEVTQSMLVQYAQSFVEAANNVYQDFSNYQDKLNIKVRENVDRINNIADKIWQLNEKIRAIETGGIEHANDLKDQRNKLLDELSGLGNIQYRNDAYGNVLVKFETHDLVLQDKTNKMAYQIDGDAGFYSVYWPDSAENYLDSFGNKVYKSDSAPVFDFSVEISSVKDTDVGALKATLLARGDHRGTYQDLASEEAYTEQPKNARGRALVAHPAVQDSIMMNTMAEFDGLVNHIVTAINDVLAAHSRPDTDGYLCVLADESDPTSYIPMELFQRGTCDLGTLNETTGKWEKTPEDVANNSTWYTTLGIVINQDLLQYPSHLSFMMPDGSVDYLTAKDLEKAFQEQKYMLNPTLKNGITIPEFYNSMVAQIANSGNVYMSLQSHQELTVNSIEATRQGTIGVSTDEELANMIRFQNAYNASSRFINVIDEMIEHIIQTLGT